MLITTLYNVMHVMAGPASLHAVNLLRMSGTGLVIGLRQQCHHTNSVTVNESNLLLATHAVNAAPQTSVI